MTEKTSAKTDRRPSTVLGWIDGVWSRNSVSYKQLFAGTGRLKNHAINTSRRSRWETSDCRWEQDRRLGRVECQSVRLRDTSKQVITVTDEVPNATDSLNIEFERVKLT